MSLHATGDGTSTSITTGAEAATDGRGGDDVRKIIKVWYKLEGNDQNHSIKLPEDEATIEELKSAVKKKWPNELRDVDEGKLRVFAAAAAANPNSNDQLANEKNILEVVPLPTTPTYALNVALPWHQQQPPPPTPNQHSPMRQFFESHSCGNNKDFCVLCCNIYHASSDEAGAAAAAAAVNSNNNITHAPVDDTFKTRVSEAINVELLNYSNALAAEEGRLPDIENILSEPLPQPNLVFKLDGTNATLASHTIENKKSIRKLLYASLYMDVYSKLGSTKDSLEGYFDGFYINLLRQLLELDGFTCDQREKKQVESKRTERKVDLIVRYDTRNILNLKSAMNPTGNKITNDRGKVAMEVYHGWKTGKRLPPPGVLVYPSESSLHHRKTCVFDVYIP
jgi:hypothetical protein